jgi:hypothetical protein
MKRHRRTNNTDLRVGAINCRVRPEQLKLIKKMADERRVSMSAMTEQALVKYLKIDLKEWDAM